MKKVHVLSLILGVAFLPILILGGCGGSSPSSPGAGGGVGAVPVIPAVVDVYVDAVAGSDASGGTQAAPWKTITHAIAAAPQALTTNIHIAPGIYDSTNGEVFPLTLKNSYNLIGDGSQGANTIIHGNSTLAAQYPITGGDAVGAINQTTIVVPPNVTASLNGLTIRNAFDYEVLADRATLIVDSCTFPPMGYLQSNGILAANGANVTVSNSIITNDSWYALVEAWDTGTTLKLRNNQLSAPTDFGGFGHAYVYVLDLDSPLPTVDMGTATDPGNNIMQALAGSASVLLSLDYASDAATPAVNASGNTWMPLVQGADAAGHYPPGMVVNTPTLWTGGQNYAIQVGAGASNPGIQFFQSAKHPKRKIK